MDLDLGWRRVLSEARRETELPDILRLADFNHVWPARKEALLARLAADEYAPQPPRVIEVAKSEFMTRPVAVLHPDDRAVYAALIDQIAAHIDAVIPDAVYSARVRRKPTPGLLLEDQRRAWLAFEKAGLELYTKHKYSSLLSTDVSSYFEYIDLGMLLKELEMLPAVDETHRKLLSRMLNEIQRNSEVWGLPQANPPSSILGNYYLLPADRILQKHPVVFLRFQDDIKVFANNATSLRVALAELISVLRQRRLNLASQKTKIVEDDDIIEEFEDMRKRSIEYNLEIDEPAALVELRDLFDQAVSGDITSRDVRYAVYRLQKHGDNHAIPWVLNNLVRVPYLASILRGYLGSHWTTEADVQSTVADYLLDREKNIYPILEMHLLRLLAGVAEIDGACRKAVWDILRDQNKREFVREWAAIAAGVHAEAGDAALLRGEFAMTGHYWLRRALLVALSLAGPSDKAWLNTVEAASPELRPTCEYLRSDPKLALA